MILRLLPILALILTVLGFGAPEPYVVESKVQQDLDGILSRIISKDQFLVQTTADIQIEIERKLVEGETVSNTIPHDPQEDPPPTMPGFVPEPTTRTPKLPSQSRQVFKNVEVPTLKQVLVHVNFDDGLPLAVVTRGRTLVENYMGTNYKGKGRATYGQMPMINPDKKRELASEQDALLKKIQDWDKGREKKEPTIEETAWRYGRWSALLFLVIIVLTQFFKPQINRFQHLYSGKINNSHKQSAGSRGDYGQRPYSDPGAFLQAYSAGPSATAADFSGGRRQLLDRFLIRSEIFRGYYDKLSADQKRDLYGALKGPGYERLLDGLAFPIPAGAEHEPHNVDELIGEHFKNFDELVKASDWQSRQYFGFVQHLSDGRLCSLLNHISAKAIAMLLRFMKPQQSAAALDSLSAPRRLEVLSAAESVSTAPIHEIQRIEKEVRDIVSQIPEQSYGSKREDLDFWGNILSESQNQEELLDAIEKTNPEIYPRLKKFRFSLEDAATLPNGLLQKVLGTCDNNELGQALASCPQDVAEVLLDAMPERRRVVLEGQIATYRRVPKEALRTARISLTKKLREVMT